MSLRSSSRWSSNRSTWKPLWIGRHPQDLSEQAAFVGALFKQLEHHLPSEIRKQSPKKYAKYYKQLAFAYATSLDRVGNVMRAM